MYCVERFTLAILRTRFLDFRSVIWIIGCDRVGRTDKECKEEVRKVPTQTVFPILHLPQWIRRPAISWSTIRDPWIPFSFVCNLLMFLAVLVFSALSWLFRCLIRLVSFSFCLTVDVSGTTRSKDGEFVRKYWLQPYIDPLHLFSAPICLVTICDSVVHVHLGHDDLWPCLHIWSFFSNISFFSMCVFFCARAVRCQIS